MRLDADGVGDCPTCGLVVRGEPGTLVSYGHPVEACRDRLVVLLRATEARLRVHGVSTPREVLT